MTDGEEMSVPDAKGRENSKERKVLLCLILRKGTMKAKEDTGTSSQVCEPRTHLPGTYFYNQHKERQSFSSNRTHAFNGPWHLV